MSAANVGAKRRWLAAALGAAAIVAVLLVLFRTPTVRAPATVRNPTLPPIKLSPGSPDELAMRDLAPLFLPTPYNAAASTLQPLEPGRSYFEQDPGTRWKFDPDNPMLRLPVSVRPPASALDALANPPPPLAAGIGRTNRTVPSLPANGGHIEVFAGDERDSLLKVTLDAEARAPSAGRETVGWKPLEFVAAVSAAGLIGPLVLTNSSGVEEVDNHFRNYLAGRFRIGDRLPPGFYRIVIGP